MQTIFEIFWQYKKVYFNPELDEDVYAKLVRELLDELEKYFKSYKWARSEIERALWQQAGKGISATLLSARYDCSEHTLRSTASRVSKRINQMFCGASNLSAVIDSFDSELVEIVRDRVKFANEAYDYWSMFPFADKLEMIKNNAYYSGDGSYTPEDIKAVIRLLVVYDKRFFDSMLYNLNPVAISKVIEELSADMPTETFEYYCKLKELVFGARNSILDKMCKRIDENYS